MLCGWILCVRVGDRRDVRKCERTNKERQAPAGAARGVLTSSNCVCMCQRSLCGCSDATSWCVTCIVCTCVPYTCRAVMCRHPCAFYHTSSRLSSSHSPHHTQTHTPPAGVRGLVSSVQSAEPAPPPTRQPPTPETGRRRETERRGQTADDETRAERRRVIYR